MYLLKVFERKESISWQRQFPLGKSFRKRVGDTSCILWYMYIFFFPVYFELENLEALVAEQAVSEERALLFCCVIMWKYPIPKARKFQSQMEVTRWEDRRGSCAKELLWKFSLEPISSCSKAVELSFYFFPSIFIESVFVVLHAQILPLIFTPRKPILHSSDISHRLSKCQALKGCLWRYLKCFKSSFHLIK